MSQENVEVVRRHHRAFVKGDREGALEPLDPEIEFVFHLFEIPSAHAMPRSSGQWPIGWEPGRPAPIGSSPGSTAISVTTSWSGMWTTASEGQAESALRADATPRPRAVKARIAAITKIR